MPTIVQKGFAPQRVFLLLCGLLAILLGTIASQARDLRVVVNASASEAYMESAKDKPYHTYHFYQGNYIKGAKRDNSLKKEDFDKVAATAAEFLKSRDFLPAAHKDSGDQLIMISWGSTRLDIDWNEEMGITDWSFSEIESGTAGIEAPESGENGSYAPETYQPEVIEHQRVSSSYKNRNMKMLGYNKGLYHKTTSPIEREKLENDLDKDRYFFVLNAFDLPHLRKNKELKQLWSCRVSVQNLGTNFKDALAVMNKVAAPTFGTNMENLMTAKVDPKSNIVIGDIKVIGIDEN